MNIKPYSVLMIALSSFIVGQSVLVAQSAPSSCQNSELGEIYNEAFPVGEMSMKLAIATNWQEYKKLMHLRDIIEYYNLNTEEKKSCWKLGIQDGMESFKAQQGGEGT